MDTHVAARPVRRARLQGNNSLVDVVAGLAERGLVSPRQAHAARELWRLLEARGGASGGLVMAYKVRIDGGRLGGSLPRGASAAGERLQRVLDRLPPSQRRLLGWLSTYAERPVGRRALSYYVTEEMGLEVPRTSASQMAIGLVQALLDALADALDRAPGREQAPGRGVSTAAAAA